MKDNSRDPIISVSTDSGCSLGISKDISLVHYDRNGELPVSLGPATLKNIESLIYALERLKKHAQ